MTAKVQFCIVIFSFLLSGCGVISATKPLPEVDDATPFGCESYLQKDRIIFDIKLASRLPPNLALIVDGELLATSCDFQTEQQMTGAFTEVSSHSLKAVAFDPDTSRDTISFEIATFESCSNAENFQSVTGLQTERLRFREFNNLESNPSCGKYNQARVQFYE